MKKYMEAVNARGHHLMVVLSEDHPRGGWFRVVRNGKPLGEALPLREAQDEFCSFLYASDNDERDATLWEKQHEDCRRVRHPATAVRQAFAELRRIVSDPRVRMRAGEERKC